jgi:serine/threonine protein kinase
VTDFGLSTRSNAGMVVRQVWNVSWLAPEIMRGHAYSTKVDVYSYDRSSNLSLNFSNFLFMGADWRQFVFILSCISMLRKIHIMNTFASLTKMDLGLVN